MQEKSNQLKENALGLSESIVMGVAGTAPAYSIAATTGVLMATVGVNSLASLLYCGLIVFGVTLAFLHLNRTNANAGASYAWVSEVFHPVLGFFAGWSLLVASTVFMVSGTVPAAIATLALIHPESVNSPAIVALVAAGWLLFVSVIVVKGVKLSSYFQVILTCVEVLLLSLIILGAFWQFASNPVVPFSFSQLSLGSFTPATFAEGALVALFFFWGWDVTVNLSEETRNAADNPGKGAVGAMLIVLFLFMTFTMGAQFALTETEIEAAGTNLVLVLSQKTFASSVSYIAVIAVMLSTIGTLETTILQFTRTLFAKGRDGILNPRYAQLHKEWKTPWIATSVIVGIGLVLLFVSAFSPSVNDVVSVSVKAIGFQIAFYYGLASIACAWRFRQSAIKTLKDFIFLFCWPVFSGFFMVFIFFYCAFKFEPMVTALGIGGILIGIIPLMLGRKYRKK